MVSDGMWHFSDGTLLTICHILVFFFFLFCFFFFLFFFSSRRRHTRSLCDWSSDVCSSDLTGQRHGDILPTVKYSNAADNRIIPVFTLRSCASGAGGCMDIHEHQAKTLLAGRGLPVPAGRVVASPEQIGRASGRGRV